MTSWFRLLVCVVCAFVLLGSGLTADDAKKDDKAKNDKSSVTVKDTGPKVPTHKVEKAPFKIEATVKGTFESEKMAEVNFGALEVWNPLSGGGVLMVAKAVEHGATVHKGDPVIWLSTEKIEQTIKDTEAERELADLSIKQAEEEIPVLEKSLPIDLALAERAKKIADEDLKIYTEIQRPFFEKMANFEVKMYTNYLEYSKEELRQLEKMYKAKDLTEETEEIILKRQRNNVEMVTFYLRQAELERDHTLKVVLPRRDQGVQDLVKTTTLALEKAKATLPLTLNQKRLSLVKQKYDREKAVTRLAKLKKDREAMIARAPADGIIYLGKCVRGQWSSTESRLHRGGMIMPEEVLATIVKPRPLFVRASVEEKQLQYLRPGLQGKVVPATLPDLRLPAKIEKLSGIPVTPGNFEARIAVELGEGAEALMPGMACTIKFVPYFNQTAVAVPSSALFPDDLDDDKYFVYVATKDGKHEKRHVTVGKRTESKVEVVQGLQEGDEVLLEKPGEGKKEPAPIKKEAKP